MTLSSFASEFTNKLDAVAASHGSGAKVDETGYVPADSSTGVLAALPNDG